MNDLDKIIGVEHIFLNNIQQKLLNKYTDCRINIKSTKTSKSESNTLLLNYLNDFYQSLDDHQRSIVTSWLSYEMCNIDQYLVTSVKISEFAVKHDLADKLQLSSDNNSFMFTVDSEDDAKRIKQLFEKEYKKINCEIVEVK